MLQMFEAWGWPYNYIRSGTDARIEVGTNTYYLYGANTEASQDALQGLTAVGAYADEAALFLPKSFIDQMIARCSVDGWKICQNCNPAGPHHFIPEDFLLPEEAKKKKVYHLHFTMDDNLSISPKRKEEYIKMHGHTEAYSISALSLVCGWRLMGLFISTLLIMRRNILSGLNGLMTMKSCTQRIGVDLAERSRPILLP